KQPETDVRGTWQLELAGSDDRVLKLTLKIAGRATRPTGVLTKAVEEGQKAEEIRLAQVAFSEGQISFRFEGKSLGKEGPARGSATVSAASDDKLTLLRTIVWADGNRERLIASHAERLQDQEVR